MGITRRQVGAGLLASAAVEAGVKAQPRQDQHMEIRRLPPPWTAGGKPLSEALMLRRSIRDYASRPLEMQVLSNLLWSAYGINRPSIDGRTAPYWRHEMVIDIYAAMADGVWRYAPDRHALLPYLAADIRSRTGRQDFVGDAPLDLVYVAHGERMLDLAPAERRLFASVDTGFIGQNVYLFCASEGLATVFRGSIDYVALKNTMLLDQEQFVTFAQTVGYPKM